MPPYEEKVGNETLSMYNSVNLRVLSYNTNTIILSAYMQMRNKSMQRSFMLKNKALLIDGYAERLKQWNSFS